MNDAGREFIAVGLGFHGGGFDLFLRPTGHGVDGGALRDGIVVAEGRDHALEVDVDLVFHVAVADAGLGNTAGKLF